MKNRFDDFFDEQPPQGFSDRVMATAAPELERNRQMAQTQNKRKALWGILTAGFATAMGFVLWNRQQDQQEQNMALAAFTDVEVEDLDLLADSDEGLVDLLEALDDIEGWEES